MDSAVKKTITKLFKRIIYAIDNGMCDNMTSEELDTLIKLLLASKKVDEKYIKKRIWRLF